MGPFETSSEALLAVRPGDGSFTGREELAGLLKDTLQDAGVELGGWDVEVVHWLAGLDVQTVAAIAGWVGRARQPGPGTAAPGAVPPAGADPVVEVLRSAADALAVDLPAWEARGLGAPAAGARRARRSAIAAADAVTTAMSRLQVRLGGDRS